MRKTVLYTFVFLLLISTPAFVAGAPLPDREKEDALSTFLEGRYDVIGKYPEGGRTYWGTVTITRQGDKLLMIRNVQGRKTTANAKIAVITADAIPVLQAHFTENGKNLQAIYMIGSDADNYARLTGRVRIAGSATQADGMEALFVRRPAE